MTIGELIGLLFLARDVAHSTHLNTRSYARHMALGDFYTGVIPLADSLAEAYQGRVGLIGKIPLSGVKGSQDIVKFLESQVEAIAAGRKEILPEDSAIQNIIDEIIGLYYGTLYKLKFLA